MSGQGSAADWDNGWTPDDAPSAWVRFRRFAASLFTPAGVIAWVLAVTVGLVGLGMSLQAGGAGYAGAIMLMVSPGVFTLVVVLGLFRRDRASEMARRFVGGLVVGGLTVGAVTWIATLVVAVIPPLAARARTSDAWQEMGATQWGTDPVWSFLLMLPLFLLLGGGLVGLAVLLLIVLPVMAFRRPGVVMQGTHVEHASRRTTTWIARLLYPGLAVFMIGLGICAFEGSSVPDGLVSGWRTVGDIARYPNLLGDAGAVVAAVGSIAFTLGLIAVGAACVIAIAVRVRGDRPDADPAA